MADRLNDEDRRAVDLVMDRPDGENSEAFAQGPAPSSLRVQSVEKILALLQLMPAHEPSPDLAARTLRTIDQALAAMKAAPAQNLEQRDPGPPV
ncbi:MAG: hypothetical protein ABSF29_08860 [Tepidisphaeraceae bacterium]|jgi:hypothetical protein